MGFRNPLTSLSADDVTPGTLTGTKVRSAATGNRFELAQVGGVGTLKFWGGSPSETPATLQATQLGGAVNNQMFSIIGDAALAGAAPEIDLYAENAPAGGWQSAIRLTSAMVYLDGQLSGDVKIPTADFTLAAVSGSAPEATFWGMVPKFANGDAGVATISGATLVLPRAGVYAVSVVGTLAGNATGLSFIILRSFLTGDVRGNIPVGNNVGNAGWTTRLPAGYVLTPAVYQNSGASRAVTGTISIARIGA